MPFRRYKPANAKPQGENGCADPSMVLGLYRWPNQSLSVFRGLIDFQVFFLASFDVSFQKPVCIESLARKNGPRRGPFRPNHWQKVGILKQKLTDIGV